MPKGFEGDYLAHVKRLGEKRSAFNAKRKLAKEFEEIIDGILGDCKADGVDRERQDLRMGM